MILATAHSVPAILIAEKLGVVFTRGPGVEEVPSV
jgi:hypothetical protein